MGGWTTKKSALRDNGTLAYSQINHKMFYKPEDVMRIIKPVERKRADRAV